MHNRFVLSKCTLDDDIDYNGCRITQAEDETITMDMNNYIKNISVLDWPRHRRKEYKSLASEDEISSYRKLPGELMSAGKATMP